MIDNKLIELHDKTTSWIQRRGIIPLNTIIMGANVLFWSTSIMVLKEYPIIWLVVAISGISMVMGFFRWQSDNGYWEDHRKTMRLNAEVAYNRDNWKFRVAVLCSSSFFVVSDLIQGELLGASVQVLLVILHYLTCCTYLGPGNYAKKRKITILGVTRGT